MPHLPHTENPNVRPVVGYGSVSLSGPVTGDRVQALVFDSIDALKRSVTASGSHWFDSSAMTFFDTVLHDLIGGSVFVTGESPDPDTSHRYTLRYVAAEPDAAGRLIVGDLGGFQRYDTIQAATDAAHTLLDQ